MALGCLLWVSLMCCLLFDGTGAGLHTKKGYRQPHSSDTSNLVDDEQDEDVSALSFDDWQGSSGQAGAYPGYNKPSRAQQPAVVPTRLTMPNAPKVDGLAKGQSRDWGQENPNEPLTFPLKPQYQRQPDPVPPQSFHVPAVESSPNQDYGTYGYGYSGNTPNFIYEEVFDYPSENAEQSPSDGSTSETAGAYDQSPHVSEWSPTAYSSEPAVPRYPDVPSPGTGSSNSGKKNPNSGKVSYRPQTPVKKVVPQRASEPILPPPPPPPPRYINQYRDGYRRFKEHLSKLKYSTEYDPVMGTKE